MLKRGSTIVDLTTAATVVFRMRLMREQELKVESSAIIVGSPLLGQVEYRWAVGDTDEAGEYYADWYVTWADSTTETFPTLNHDVVLVSSDIDQLT